MPLLNNPGAALASLTASTVTASALGRDTGCPTRRQKRQEEKRLEECNADCWPGSGQLTYYRKNGKCVVQCDCVDNEGLAETLGG